MRTIYVDYKNGSMTSVRGGRIAIHEGVSRPSLARLHRFFWRAGCGWAMIQRDDRHLRFGYSEILVTK